MSTPLVVALVGLPGSGKTTLAGFLRARFGLREINRDRIRAALFPADDGSEANKHQANAAVRAVLEANCMLGIGCVMDGMTLGRRADRDGLRHIVEKHSALFILLWLDCPLEIAAARVAGDKSGHPARDRDAKLVKSVAERFEPPEEALRLDATQSPHILREAAVWALLERRYATG